MGREEDGGKSGLAMIIYTQRADLELGMGEEEAPRGEESSQ